MKIQIILSFMITLFLSGCFQKSESIKHTSPYNTLIGGTYESLVPLKLYGVTMASNYEESVSLYILLPPPGASGPEILSRVILPVGTTIKVKDVRRCTNCFIWSPISILVDIASYDADLRLPIELYADVKKSMDGSKVVLDPELFLEHAVDERRE